MARDEKGNVSLGDDSDDEQRAEAGQRERGFAPRCQAALAGASKVADLRFLYPFPKYVTFRSRRKGRDPKQDNWEKNALEPQDGGLQAAYERMVGLLAADVLRRLKTCPVDLFSRFVYDVVMKMTYGDDGRAGLRVISTSGGGSVQYLVEEDSLGAGTVCIQALQKDGDVGLSEVKKFACERERQGADRGLFITTGEFGAEVTDYLSETGVKISLIDGNTLARFMVDNNIGVSKVATYNLKKIDADLLEDD